MQKLRKAFSRVSPLGDGFPGGEVNVNTNAGKNIKNRLHDDEIHRYTPYKKIKEILENRYKLNQLKLSLAA